MKTLIVLFAFVAATYGLSITDLTDPLMGLISLPSFPEVSALSGIPAMQFPDLALPPPFDNIVIPGANIPATPGTPGINYQPGGPLVIPGIQGFPPVQLPTLPSYDFGYGLPRTPEIPGYYFPGLPDSPTISLLPSTQDLVNRLIACLSANRGSASTNQLPQIRVVVNTDEAEPETADNVEVSALVANDEVVKLGIDEDSIRFENDGWRIKFGFGANKIGVDEISSTR